MKNIVKILTALATVAGAVYIIATYGDKIVAWAQKIWDSMPKKASVELEVDLTGDEAQEETAEAAGETAAEAEAVEVPVEEAVEEAPEVVVTENEPVAAEEDFAE